MLTVDKYPDHVFESADCMVEMVSEMQYRSGGAVELTKRVVSPLFSTHSNARGIISSSYSLHACSTSSLDRLLVVEILERFRSVDSNDTVSRIDWLPPMPLYTVRYLNTEKHK